MVYLQKTRTPFSYIYDTMYTSIKTAAEWLK